MHSLSVVSGCRAALVNVEAQPLSALSYLRKCVVAMVKDLTIDRFKDAVQQNAGGLLVVVPSNLSQLPDSEKEVCTSSYCVAVLPSCCISLFRILHCRSECESSKYSRLVGGWHCWMPEGVVV